MAVLVFIDYYLPGYRSGGPIRALSNLVDYLKQEVEFYIVTRNKDVLSEECYANIVSNQWIEVQGAKVMYLEESYPSLKKIYQILKERRWDCIYLNSFFSYHFSIKVRFIAKLFFSHLLIILAPRGEFYPGALKIKLIKKHLYIFLSRCFGFYKKTIWHLTDKSEYQYVNRFFFIKTKAVVAEDLVKLNLSKEEITYLEKKPGTCRFVFVSRITRKKNLHLCLEILKEAKGKIDFYIYGPIRDSDYWERCLVLIRELPNNIHVEYRGEVSHKETETALIENHFLFLPTAGENFCYAVFESLAVGRPVLIGSDTPWKKLVSKNVGMDLDPMRKDLYIRAIKEIVELDQTSYNRMVDSCYHYAEKVANRYQQQIVNYRKLFQSD